ncbi:MAG: dihydropteroate synthase [Spirochaetales bacterium]|jgi:dihydropteroate synthase|nr:dihydropteroate synthase [Spirochaetales bacterium]
MTEINFPGPKPWIMGIINLTPDSFFPSSRKEGEGAVRAAALMEEQGADLIDLGGESSRPGAEYVDEVEELRRVIPVVEAIRRHSRLPLSIDTRRCEVARRALDAGADLINDISALGDDPALGLLAAERGVPVILMHKRGIPRTMQDGPFYRDPVGEVAQELLEAVDRARGMGIAPDRIILDPGIGFGKRPADNWALLRDLPRLKALGFPLLFAASRKGFIGDVLDQEVENRELGSLLVHYHAALLGADMVRVHDVAPMIQARKILLAVLGGR